MEDAGFKWPWVFLELDFAFFYGFTRYASALICDPLQFGHFFAVDLQSLYMWSAELHSEKILSFVTICFEVIFKACDTCSKLQYVHTVPCWCHVEKYGETIYSCHFPALFTLTTCRLLKKSRFHFLAQNDTQSSETNEIVSTKTRGLRGPNMNFFSEFSLHCKGKI